MVEQPVGVILAGGLARRFGGQNKSQIDLSGRPLIEHVMERISPQVSRLILNLNDDGDAFSHYGYEIVPDGVAGNAGPLAGVLAALEWVKENEPTADWVLSVPTDAPVLPTNLVEKMMEAIHAEGADMACAVSNGRRHPVIALWPVSVTAALRQALVIDDIRKIDRFTAPYKMAKVEFSADDFDPFMNINTPEDLQQAVTLLPDGRRTDKVDPSTIPMSQRVGIVVEHRESQNPWSDGSWKTVEVLCDIPADAQWQKTNEGDGWTRYFAGVLEVEMFKGETVGYKTNLAQPTAGIYVVLRPGEDDDEPDVVPFLATLSPYEAEDYTESGEMFVDVAPIPPKLADWANAFIEAFHVDQPFKKRKQRRKSDSATGRGGDTFERAKNGK